MGARLHPDLREVLEPRLKEIESLKGRIQEYELRMEKIANESYRQIELLKQVNGVETQIALTSMLTLDDPHRFAKSREVGCFLRWRPGRRTWFYSLGRSTNWDATSSAVPGTALNH